MAATPIPFSSKDNASGNLDSGINASATTIPLESGDGANFPQPYSGTTTSGGSSTTLNCTGISATIGGSAQEGKWIWNKTDGSVAKIVTVSTNSLTTTRLLGGTDNSWDNSDTWCIDPFVITIAQVSTNAYGVESVGQKEQALVIGRSTDNLTVATSGRGYNGTIANTFIAGDYVYLNVTSPIVERLKDILAVVATQVNTNVTSIATNGTDIDNIENGGAFYVAAAGSSNAFTGTFSSIPSLAAGTILIWKANHTITGSSTLNPTIGGSAQGAKTIKKMDGATNLASNDIISGQIVITVYDGTNLQMVSPIGQISQDVDVLKVNIADSAAVGASSTAENDMNVTHSITAAQWAAGRRYPYKISGKFTKASGNLDIRVKLGSTTLGTLSPTTNSADVQWQLAGYLVCRSVNASGTVNSVVEAGAANGALLFYGSRSNGTFDTTTTQILKVSAQFSASDGTHACLIENFNIDYGQG